jgi:hypothetical protein
MRELVGEVWQELVNLDGKVARTLRLLVTRPGFLTSDSLAGRRARYIGPFRLYLLCSVVYFVVSAGLPDHDHGRITTSGSASVRITRGEPAPAPAAGDPNSCRPREPREPDWAWWLRRLDCKSDRNPAAFERAWDQNQPRVMFLLLPAYAAILALFFRGRTYPEHVIFALHLHAFVFLGLLAARAADLWPDGDGWVDGFVSLLVAAYSVVALRRAYGRSWGSTLARSVGVGATYGLVFLVVFFGAMIVTLIVTTLGR